MKEIVMEGHQIQGKWILVPLLDVLTPKPGRMCHGPRWWAVTDNDEVLFFKSYHSPQCNIHKGIVDRLGMGYGAPPTTPRYLEMTFLPHSCND